MTMFYLATQFGFLALAFGMWGLAVWRKSWTPIVAAGFLFVVALLMVTQTPLL